jgi:hypothetical protein
VEGQLGTLRAKHRELEQRRALDLEGFTADVTTLRRLLSAVDRRLHQTRSNPMPRIPKLYTLNPKPLTLRPLKPDTPNPKASTLKDQPQTLNPEPQTLNPKPSTLDPHCSERRLVQRLDDDERLDLLLEQLEKRAPDPRGRAGARGEAVAFDAGGSARGGGAPGGPEHGAGRKNKRGGGTAAGGGGRGGAGAGGVALDAAGVELDIQHIRRALGSVEVNHKSISLNPLP